MSVTHTAPLLSPEEILTRQSVEAERIRLPDAASVFGDRALRLRQLAAGHTMRDFLIFMADVAQAQQQALNTAHTVTLPSQSQLDDALHQGVPPLALARWPLKADWQAELDRLIAKLLPQTAPSSAVHTALQKLRDMPAAQRQQQAERLLGGIMLGLDLALAPLIGAALQVHAARLVTQTQAAHPGRAFAPVDDGRVCPCCGSQPVASVRRLGSVDGNARYLHCGLCQTEWHMVRIKCTHCGTTEGIHYEALERTEGAAPTVEAAQGAVQAECCDGCGHYLKIMAMDKDPHVDPVADDIATVALDLLVSDTGLQRHGLNLLLLWGEPPEAAPEHPSPGAS